MKLFYSICVLFIVKFSWAQKFNFEALIGPVYNTPSSLTIKQTGFEDYRMTAQYKSEPFVLPPYYDFRLSYWIKDSLALGLKFTHHKIILQNENEVVQSFSITHGYNLLSAYLAKKLSFLKGSLFEFGFGAIIGHPEGKIRDVEIDQTWGPGSYGYRLSGFVIENALIKRFYLSDWLFLPLEIRNTLGYARVKIHDGVAIVPNYAFHFLIGIGLEF